MCLVYLFFFIAISSSFDLFPENGKYTYRLKSFITLVPDLHSQENPQWTLNGLLEVEKGDSRKLTLRVNICRFLQKKKRESYFINFRSNLTKVVTQNN